MLMIIIHWRCCSELKFSSLSRHLMERKSQGVRGRAWSFCRAAWKFIFMNYSVISDIEVYLSFYILGMAFILTIIIGLWAKPERPRIFEHFSWKKMFTCILRLGSSCRQTRPAGSSENMFCLFWIWFLNYLAGPGIYQDQVNIWKHVLCFVCTTGFVLILKFYHGAWSWCVFLLFWM